MPGLESIETEGGCKKGESSYIGRYAIISGKSFFGRCVMEKAYGLRRR